MKKTLIALAAVAATGVAMADVSIGGRLDFGYTTNKVTAPDSTTGVETTTKTTQIAGGDSQRTSDRLTFKGSEDLGGGLKAGFEYTVSLEPDNSSTGSAFGTTREAFVTVGGGFGTVKMGTFTNVFDGMVGNTWQNATGLSGGNVVWVAGRTANTIAYASPSFNGFTVGYALANDKVTTSTATTSTDVKNEASILSLGYAAGPLSVTAGIGSQKVGAAGAKTSLGGVSSDTFDANAKVSATAIKASYDLGMATPYLLYANSKIKGNVNAVAGEAGVKSTEIGVTAPIGAYTLGFSTISAKGKSLADGIKYTGYEANVAYSLSKRTTAYATLGQKKVKDSGTQVYKKTATAIGIAHTF